jgi:hypothetical protein
MVEGCVQRSSFRFRAVISSVLHSARWRFLLVTPAHRTFGAVSMETRVDSGESDIA